MRPVYRSTVLIEAKQSTGGAVVKFQNVEQTQLDSRAFLQTQVNVIKSNGVARAVIDDLGLDDDPELNGTLRQRGFVSGFRELWRTIHDKIRKGDEPDVAPEVATPDDAMALAQERARVRRFVDRIRVSPIKDSILVKISFDSFDRQKSTDIANSIANAYIHLSDERRFNSSSSAKAFLQKEIAKTQAQLERSEKDLTAFARENKIIDVEDKGDIMTARLEELSAALTAVQTQRIEAETDYRQATVDATDTVPAVLQQPLVESLKGQLAGLTAEYMRLSGIYKQDYPALKQLSEQIAQLESSIAQESTKIVGGLKANYNKFLERELLVSEQLEEQKKSLLDLKDRSIQYNILKREWETNKELYAGLLERVKEVGVAAGMELDNLAVIDAAEIPERAHKPIMPVNIVLGIILGLVLGVGLALLLAFLDNTINSSEELERVAQLASLGLVPSIDTESLPHGYSIDLISHQSRDNQVSEAFRSVRTSLMFSSPDGAPQVLLITSSMSSEGKSVSAANIALVLAQNDAKVLLVDADLRKPRAHKIFHIPSSPGLSEYLTQEKPPNVIRRTELSTLHILTAGVTPPNPAELLGSSKMDGFLASVRDRYDHIILDAPPILGLADSVILGTKVDGLLMVVSANQVKKDAVRESVKRLRMVRAPIIGAMMNRVDISNGEYSYYDEYMYGYSQEGDISQKV